MTSQIEEIDLTEETYTETAPKLWKERKPAKKNEIFFCTDCHKTFTRKCNYIHHVKFVHYKTRKLQSLDNKSELTNQSKDKDTASWDNKLLECPICLKVFMNESNLTKHLEVHSVHQSVNCNKCNKEFLDLSSLNEHLVTCTNYQDEMEQVREKVKNYCALCQRNFFYESALEKHKELHLTKEPMFTCQYCPQKFFQRTNLVQHEITHTRPLYSCFVCNRIFFKKHNLNSHMRLHVIESPKVKCHQCGKSFKSKYSLEIHIKNHIRSARFKCRGCDRVFSTRTTFMRHMQTKINNNTKYKCQYCGKVCCHKKNLDKHIATQCNIANRTFRCPRCDENFTTKVQLQTHMHSHVNIRKIYLCSSCSTAFASEFDLYMHQISDDGTALKCDACKEIVECLNIFKQHVCSEEALNDEESSAKDEILNEKEKLFEATVYKTPQNKIKHRDHTYAMQSWPIKPYKCKKCGKHFCRSVNLEKHIQEFHPFYFSSESSEENSEDELHERKVNFTVPKIGLITSLNANEKIFVNEDNINDSAVYENDHMINQDEQLVDPLLIDDETDQRNSNVYDANDVQEFKIDRNIIKIEPQSSEESLQFNRFQMVEDEAIDIKQENIDYESS